MNLGSEAVEKLKFFLNKQKQANVTGQNQRISFNERLGKIHLHTEVEDFDKFSLVIRKLELKKSQEKFGDNVPIEVLLKQADDLVNKVTYLLENLAIIEVDSTNDKIQIRSTSPHRENGVLRYYEIILDNIGKITLERFEQKVGDKQRVQIPFKLTEEVLERLINDLALL